MINKMEIKDIKIKDKIEINNKTYEVIRIEDDYWYFEKQGVKNRGKGFILHELGDEKLHVPEPKFYLYFNNKNKKLELHEITFKENEKVPKDFRKSLGNPKISENKIIPIKRINKK